MLGLLAGKAGGPCTWDARRRKAEAPTCHVRAREDVHFAGVYRGGHDTCVAVRRDPAYGGGHRRVPHHVCDFSCVSPCKGVCTVCVYGERWVPVVQTRHVVKPWRYHAKGFNLGRDLGRVHIFSWAVNP